LEAQLVTIRHELPCDIARREILLDRAFGKGRRRKTSERLRERRLPAERLAFSAVDAKGKVIGTIRLWDIIAGSAGPALLLGPVAVDCRHQKNGIGAAMMRHAIAEARRLGHSAIVLVGDTAYYGRFGFGETGTRSLHLPGPVERSRFLGLELVPGALDGAEGLVSPAGRLEEIPLAA
jgi:predicted N-acetyltransferase YhbS